MIQPGHGGQLVPERVDQLRAVAGHELQRAEHALLRRLAGSERVVEAADLTPSERDVAMLSIKGLSIADMAGLRETKEGTIKAQCNAVYRKAGVTGRPQLLSLFIEELMAESLVADTP